MAGTVGTLAVGINADPTGLTKGFQRTASEMKQFERAFGSATNRMTSALTMTATHFAILGKTSGEQMKQIVAGAIGLASVFGPGGQIISAIGLLGTMLWTFHNRAREEAEATKKKYDDMFKDLSLRHDFAATIEQANEFGRTISALRVEAARLRDLIPAGPPALVHQALIGPAGQPVVSMVDPFAEQRKSLEQLTRQIADLEPREAEFGRLLASQGQSARDLAVATALAAKQERERAEALQASARAAKEILGALSDLAAPSKLPSVWEDLKTGLPKVSAADAIRRQVEAANESLAELGQIMKAKAQEWDSIFQRAGRGLADVFGDALVGHIRNFRDFASQIVAVWQNMIAQMIASKLYSSVFGDFFASLAGSAAGGGGTSSGAGGGGGHPGGGFPRTPDPHASISSAPTYPVTVNLNLTAMDGASAARVLEANKGKIATLVVDAIKTSRQAERDIRGRR